MGALHTSGLVYPSTAFCYFRIRVAMSHIVVVVPVTVSRRPELRYWSFVIVVDVTASVPLCGCWCVRGDRVPPCDKEAPPGGLSAPVSDREAVSVTATSTTQQSASECQ